MNEVFREFFHRFVIVYIDDILIYSRNLADHRHHVTQVLQKIPSRAKGLAFNQGYPVAVKFVRKTPDSKYISTPFHPEPLPLEIALAVISNRGPSCPNIIQMLDWQDDPEHYVMIMELLLPSMDMHTFLKLNGGILKEPTAQQIMRQVIMPLAFAVIGGVFHGDIKLKNLLINLSTLEVKLIDFGCGDLLRDSALRGMYCTKPYIPPEYYDTGKYHAKLATVFPLGVLLFKMDATKLLLQIHLFFLSEVA
ncbi:hypothetical protein PO909_020665 [Leuciscus waleckii]